PISRPNGDCDRGDHGEGNRDTSNIKNEGNYGNNDNPNTRNEGGSENESSSIGILRADHLTVIDESYLVYSNGGSSSIANNIRPSSFGFNQSSRQGVQSDQNFARLRGEGTGLHNPTSLREGSKLKRMNYTTGKNKDNCKTGETNNKCKENAGSSLTSSVSNNTKETKNSQKPTALEKALADTI
ncbi:7995_t:CDS:1, partial [Entrophospora sp. SA101]